MYARPKSFMRLISFVQLENIFDIKLNYEQFFSFQFPLPCTRVGYKSYNKSFRKLVDAIFIYLFDSLSQTLFLLRILILCHNFHHVASFFSFHLWTFCDSVKKFWCNRILFYCISTCCKVFLVVLSFIYLWAHVLCYTVL